MEIFGWLATLGFALCYWPQIYRTWKLKTVGDISFSGWFIQFLAYLCGLEYGFKLKQLPLIVGYLHGLLCTVILLILYKKYRGNK